MGGGGGGCSVRALCSVCAMSVLDVFGESLLGLATHPEIPRIWVDLGLIPFWGSLVDESSHRSKWVRTKCRKSIDGLHRIFK